MYTPVNLNFTVQKWGVLGYTLHVLVRMLKVLRLWLAYVSGETSFCLTWLENAKDRLSSDEAEPHVLWGMVKNYLSIIIQ